MVNYMKCTNMPVFATCNCEFDSKHNTKYKYASESSTIISKKRNATKTKIAPTNLNHHRKQYINDEQKHRFLLYFYAIRRRVEESAIVDVARNNWNETNFDCVLRFSARHAFYCINSRMNGDRTWRVAMLTKEAPRKKTNQIEAKWTDVVLWVCRRVRKLARRLISLWTRLSLIKPKPICALAS